MLPRFTLNQEIHKCFSPVSSVLITNTLSTCTHGSTAGDAEPDVAPFPNLCCSNLPPMLDLPDIWLLGAEVMGSSREQPHHCCCLTGLSPENHSHLLVVRGCLFLLSRLELRWSRKSWPVPIPSSPGLSVGLCNLREGKGQGCRLQTPVVFSQGSVSRGCLPLCRRPENLGHCWTLSLGKRSYFCNLDK